MPGFDLTTFDFVLGFALATQPTLSLAPAVVCPPPFLTQIQRTSDKAFSELQEAIRLGKWDKKIETELKRRVSAALPPPPEKRNAEKDYYPVLVTRNATRALLQNLRMQAICDSAVEDSEIPILLFAHMLTKKPHGTFHTQSQGFLKQ